MASPSNGWEDGSVNLRIRRGEGDYILPHSSTPNDSAPNYSDASPDGEIPPKVRQMARDQGGLDPLKAYRAAEWAAEWRRRAWGSGFVDLHQFRDAPISVF